MTSEADSQRLVRQADAAAQRLAKQTGEAAIVAVIHDFEGGAGVAWAADGPRLGQIELAMFHMLRQLEQDLMPGAAAGCEDCAAAYARVSGAVASLAPGFGPDAAPKGCC